MVVEPKELSEEAKQQILKQRADVRNKIMFDTGVELEVTLFGLLGQMEDKVDELFLQTVPFTSNAENFLSIIGANLTEDPNGYLSLPADVVLIGGAGSTFTSKTATLKKFVTDKDISLSVRDIPLEDAIGIVASSLGIEYTFSPEIISTPRSISLSLRSSALSILDAILTQNNLAIMYDSNLEIARFYTDAELVFIDVAIKEAIRGHNELLFAKKKLDRAEADFGEN